jgi:glucose/arabinose dehydrogenase
MDKNKNIIVILILAIFFYNCNSNGKDVDSPDNDKTGFITLPKGFKATIVAEKLGNGRHMAINENGDIYLSLRIRENGKGIVALRDTTGNGVADIIKYFGDDPGTGLGIYDGYLYFGSNKKVVRYELVPGELVPANDPEVIVSGFPEQGQHATKTFTFDDQGYIYVNVGAPSNACMEKTRTIGSKGVDPCQELEKHAGIWRFEADKPNQQQEDGIRYATGIRHGVALDWNHEVNELYMVQHGRDQLHQLFPDIYSEDEGVKLPAEEFLLIEEGDNFGWPYCYYDHFKDKKVLAPEYGGDGEKVGRCSGMKNPIMSFPAHVAPNDLLFYSSKSFPGKYHNGAFIAFHGSWNRAPQEQEGYYVVFVSFEGKMPSGDWEIFADGFKGKETIYSPGEAKYRPCGLAIDPGGNLYINESNTGKIWKIEYTGM